MPDFRHIFGFSLDKAYKCLFNGRCDVKAAHRKRKQEKGSPHMPRTTPGKTRRRVYEFVRRRILAGTPPTVREVQAEFGFRAVQSARQHLIRNHQQDPCRDRPVVTDGTEIFAE